MKAEKDYYDRLFQENKDNLKKSWCILKEIINKKKSASINSVFRINNKIVTDKTSISNGFNSFFVNVGPDLAKNIPHTDKSSTTFLNNRNINSMFINLVTEEEIESIIKKTLK